MTAAPHVALQLAALHEQAGLSQAELARKLKTTQQQISRLESPGYEGHSLSMLRRVAKALHARVRVVLEAEPAGQSRRAGRRPRALARERAREELKMQNEEPDWPDRTKDFELRIVRV